MIDQVVIFGDLEETGEFDDFVTLLRPRFMGIGIIAAKAGLADVHAQVESLPGWNYRTERVVAILVGAGSEREIETALRLVGRKSSFNNVVIATQRDDEEYNRVLLLNTSSIPRMVIALQDSALAWKSALDGFDLTHPGWDE